MRQGWRLSELFQQLHSSGRQAGEDDGPLDVHVSCKVVDLDPLTVADEYDNDMD
jgi:hypothetical protein